MKLNLLPSENRPVLRPENQPVMVAQNIPVEAGNLREAVYQPLRAGHLVNAKRFRASYLRVFAPLCIAFVVCGSVLLFLLSLALLSSLASSPEEVRSFYQPYLAVGIPLEALLAGLFLPFFRVDVAKEGLEATTFWGRRYAVRWGEMVSARKVWFCGYLYLKVQAKQGPDLWVPLVAKERREFLAEIAESAPAGNVLWEALNKGSKGQ